MYISRLQQGLHANMKHTEDIGLTYLTRKERKRILLYYYISFNKNCL